jgi:muramidase (phage lysozyme)
VRRQYALRRRQQIKRLRRRLLLLTVLGTILAIILAITHSRGAPQQQPSLAVSTEFPPLEMTGGDPYVRALMRTISISEARDPKPYTVLYGGEHFQDLSQHPDVCHTIQSGPNQGSCTTAAGRYQFLSTTWYEKSRLYHPQSHDWQAVTADTATGDPSYSFEPEFQDQVVYAWLTDPEAWEINIPRLLHQGQLDRVLRHLSATWTSLESGSEMNVHTSSLQAIYQRILQEEKLVTLQAEQPPQPPALSHSY